MVRIMCGDIANSWPDLEEESRRLRALAAIDQLPGGWSHVGFADSKEECVTHVDEIWTDMRPLSLRQALADN